ncbi:CYTH domain-containing protein [Thermocoleostomius sinensis]|jgi:CYTH domain-containing protein|uniref:CYTH domain-containing protein n=1 Tax=Thermocoleostomius sinensis A174 TaxID=2016057 RepID=A0A9E9C9T6_9CYAN|nr:CYTH domain-containing protein [Thermocoleostomius sinensis]WAL60032.1 CYTH domain-containing protein [Thermocoleostomius sinensis A174]
MAMEIERKFLVVGDAWRSLAIGVAYRQGYLLSNKHLTVRVRMAGDTGYLTIKGATDGISRTEFEYAIPANDAAELLDTLCERPLIEKVRYRIPWQGLVWEVDEFAGANQGLVIAEVELSDPEQLVSLPAWIGKEVSYDPRYYNAQLAKHPYSEWKDQD